MFKRDTEFEGQIHGQLKWNETIIITSSTFTMCFQSGTNAGFVNRTISVKDSILDGRVFLYIFPGLLFYGVFKTGKDPFVCTHFIGV